MRAVWIRARREMRRRLGATLALALIVGVSGGVVLTAVAGARRTRSVLDRMRVATRDADLGAHPTIDLAKVLAIPGVADAGSFAYMFMRLPDEADKGIHVVPFFAADDHAFRTVVQGLLLAGRRADPARAEEIVISDGMARRRNLKPGSTVRLQVATEEDIVRLFSGDGSAKPTGSTFVARVTGVFRMPLQLVTPVEDQDVEYLGGDESMLLTRAFHQRYVRPNFGEDPVSLGETDVLLTDPSMLPSVRAALLKLVGPGGVVDLKGEQLTPAKRALDVQAFALVAFALIGGASAWLIVGQGLARTMLSGSEEHDALSALGMTRGDLTVVGLIRAAVIGLAGVAFALPIAIAGSSFMPVGLARLAEPDPGVALDVPVLAIGALALFGAVMLRALLPSLHAARTTSSSAPAGGAERASVVAGALASVGAGPTVVTGVRMAVHRERGLGRVPVRTTVIGIAAALTSTTTALTFGASLNGLVQVPQRYGWSWDAVVGNPNNGDPADPSVDPGLAAANIKVLDGEPVVEAFSEAISFQAQVGSVPAWVVASGTEHGLVFPPLIDGRQPDGINEIAVTDALARHARLHVGSRVRAMQGASSREFTVVGVSVGAAMQTVVQGSTDDGVVMTLRTARGFAPKMPPYLYFVRYAPGVSPAAGYAALRRDFDRPIVLQPLLPADVSNLRAVRWTPYALVAMLLLIGVGTVAHLLLTSVRRRRRELAVLKTLGFVRSQVSSSVAWQASTLAVLSLAVGLPAGLALGRWAWSIVVSRLGLVAVPELPMAWIALVIGGTLAVTNLAAAIPGWIAARIRPAVALRAE